MDMASPAQLASTTIKSLLMRRQVQFRCAGVLSNLADRWMYAVLHSGPSSRYGCHWHEQPAADYFHCSGRRSPRVLHGMAGILRAQPDINVVALCGDGIAAA